MKKIALLLLFVGQIIWSNNLTITNVTKSGDNQLMFDISWDNSWKTSEYHDAVWIFIKYRNSSGQWQHLEITTVNTSDFDGFMPTGNKGLIIYRLPSNSGTGTLSGTVQMNFDASTTGPLPDFKVFGIEMVRVNEGAFYVGDGVATNGFYRGDNNTLPYQVSTSGLLTVGNTSNDINANGLSSNIPATYPTGFDEFYIMKYELSQEQYVEFLNTLTAVQQQARTQSDLSTITSANRYVLANNNIPGRRNSIACDANATNAMPITFYCDLNNNSTPNEANDGQNIACNYLTFNDCLAYLEWSGLSPLTDMEYEKAARGPSIPIVGDYANGTTLITSISTISNSGQINESVTNINTDDLCNMGNDSGSPIRVGTLATSSSTRLQSGGSFFGAMELSGNITDLVIYTSDASLTYTSNNGSGQLDTSGNSTTWNGSFDAYTDKGGGYYGVFTVEISSRSYLTDFNAMNNFNASQYGLRGAIR